VRPVVILPTYNEAQNIRPIIEAILGAAPEAHVVVVDDDSPDGTWRIVKQVAARDSRVHLIHRKARRGRGHAGAEGFRWCLERNFDPVIEMDADFSHDPFYIPQMIAESRGWDVVIGSRAVAGGGESGRGILRRLVTRLARAYLRFMLGVRDVRDPTSGYRCFRREALRRIQPETLTSPGPAIISEVLHRCRGMRIREIPIRFHDRRRGRSKFGLKAMWESLATALRLRLRGG